VAVYTKFSQQELSSHLQNYELGEVFSYQEILDGIDNSNFVLQTASQKFILTIFESRIDKASLPFFIDLKAHLANKGISCPKPLFSTSGETILEFLGKKSVIVSFLPGKSLPSQDDGYLRDISKQHCFAVGEFLGNMHLAGLDFCESKKNEIGVFGFGKFFKRFAHLADGFLPGLENEISLAIADLEENWPIGQLPIGAAHLDLFPDNLFFEDNDSNSARISGVIDFYFAATDLLVYDFAIAVNAWCFEPKLAKEQEREELKAIDNQQNQVFPEFVPEKYAAMLAGYEKIRKLSKSETNFLPIALKAAALRFLLTRLHDFFFTPKDSLVRIKNPLEYLLKLRFFSKRL
jgi:homoserine kinase type II